MPLLLKEQLGQLDQQVPHLLLLALPALPARLVRLEPRAILDLLVLLVRSLVQPAQLALLEKQDQLGQHQQLQDQQALPVTLVLSQALLALQAQHPRLLDQLDQLVPLGMPLLLPDPPVPPGQLDLQAHQALPEQPDSKAAELT